MDTELFMECEEEELEPWQQVDDSVEEDDVDFIDSYCEPVEDSQSPPPASEATPPRTPPPITLPPRATLPRTPAVTAPLQNVSSSAISPAPLPSVTTSSHLPTSSTTAVSAPPLMAQAPPLILTQTARGTFLLPAAPGTGTAQPILLTTQGFPVVNSGTSLLLNLQPGQTVQPLTLIQSPSLGHLVRPSVGVSPIVPQGQAVQTRPLPQPASALTAMRLPATLTIHTSTPGPVNVQANQMGVANSLKVAGSPALPLGSANGFTRTTRISSASGSSTSVGPSPNVVTSAPSSDPPRVVMSVEEFYYGTFDGDLSLRKPLPLGIKTSTFSCQICSYLAENNLRLMQHMLQHSELIRGPADERKCCRFCYRQFSSPAQLKSHQEQVHDPSPCTSMCRICEWAFENEPAFLNHMKSNHKPGEMPYICQVCSYHSSFYSDVLQHFASFHRDSRFLLCLFCLKVTRNPSSYQQHVLRHQINQAFHCNRCRLQFVFLKDKMQHKLENHRSFRRPAQLEGLPPGSKVTIRTYGKIRPTMTSAGSRLLQNPLTLVQPINIKTEPPQSPIHWNPGLSNSTRSPTKRLAHRRDHLSSVCLECGSEVSDFSSHYPTHVCCLLCSYSSCCSRAYAAHMIHHHVPRSKDQILPLHRLPPPSPFLLKCSHCEFTPLSGDQMAEHLLTNPEHHSSICRPRTFVERDLQFCYTDDQGSSDQNQDMADPFWRSADHWKLPCVANGGELAIIPFTQISGPYHSMSKNSDAIDFFNLVFPAALVELIATETNNHAKTCRFLGSGEPDWVPITAHEVKGFIGLVILMGIQNLPDPSQYWSWSHYNNSYTFYRAMSYKRFKQIATNIRMGSFATEEHRGSGNAGDSLHIFRPMLELLGKAVWEAYRPNCCLTIDRALLPSLEEDDSYRTSRGTRTQPQLWLLCDSKSGYCHRFFIQVGEQAGHDPGFTVVPELVKDLDGKHHQLYLANSLASVPLMQKLLKRGIYASSSFPPPSSIIPRELWEDGSLQKPGDYLQKQCGPLLATRWRDTKEMGCLSTNAAPREPDTVWRRSQTKVGGLDPISRPMAFRLLQENMRGVDICKQLLACNPLGGIPQDQHWRSLFWFLVNLSIVNAFIVLRESRKENPPAWVQDGLFTQVNFRKLLGNQLAKCAQKHLDRVEVTGSRGTRVEPTDELVKLRHRMAKISGISKRCKNCNLKNLRHESVYGCIVCKANLCKHPNCFWEFHGMSPLHKGSTKVGFIKDIVSGAVEVDEVKNGVDEAMAPVEDMDFSDDLDEADEESEDMKEEPISEVKHLSATNGLTEPGVSSDFLSARQLRIVLFALCNGVRRASREFSIAQQSIRKWLKEAEMQLKQSERGLESNGEDRLVAWVLSMREQQLLITETELFHKASTLKKKGNFDDSFLISYNWAVGFMLRQSLAADRVSFRLLTSPETKVRLFREFTQKTIEVQELSGSCIAAMDELCLFVDFSLVHDKNCRSDALQLSGSSPLLTVFLTALADGTMLSLLVLLNQQLGDFTLPDFILLESSKNFSMDEALELWTNKVWLPHIALSRARKSILVLDRHREHLGDQFLSSVSGSGTLPAVVPAGCCFCLHPLDIVIKPVLQRFLLTRWEKFTAGNPNELEETSPNQLHAKVAQLLVSWLVEAFEVLKQNPQVWKTSFCLTGILPNPDEEPKTETQQELIKNPTEEPRNETQLELLKNVKEEPQMETQQEIMKNLTEDLRTETQKKLLKDLAELLLGTKDLEAYQTGPEELEHQEEQEHQEREEEKWNEGKKAEEKGKDRKETDKESEQGDKNITGEGREKSNKENEDMEIKKRLREKGKATEEAGTETEEERKETDKEGKETEEERKETDKEGKETEEERKETDKEGKETEEERKETDKEGKETEEERKETDKEGKETEEERKETDKEGKETEEERKVTDKEGKEPEGVGKKLREPEKTTEEGKKTDKHVIKKIEEDSEEEGKETEVEGKEVNKERRETRIVIGEEVGDEWKIKSRSEGVEERMDES